MPTDRNSPSSSLLETMRLLARDRATGTSQGGRSTGVESKAGGGTPAPVRQIAELRNRLHEMARQADLDNPQSVMELRTPVLREILLWEFGSNFRQDSQFLPMIESISQALDIDPHLQQRFVDMLAGLKKV